MMALDPCLDPCLDPWSLELSGTRLIEASAGTGKTYTLTTLYLRLLVEQDLLPSQILVVTYTHAATAELRERVRSRIREAIAVAEDPEAAGSEPALKELASKALARSAQSGRIDPLRRALQEFDEAAIFTIHGFCQRTLQEHAFESGVAFDAKLVEESESLNRALAHDLWSRLIDGEEPDFVEWLRHGAGRRWQFEPDALRRSIMEKLGADEEMPVLPASVSAGDVETRELTTLRLALEEVWIRWARVWQERRESVSKRLLGANDLNKRSYKRETIESKWIPSLDNWAARIRDSGNAGSMNAFELPGWWKNIVPEGLEKGLKKGGRPVEDPFFEICGEVKDRLTSLDAARRARALSLRIRFVAEARQEARKRREERHLLFFDDLLSELRAALRPAEGDRLADLLRNRYRFALIDEFQDTDPVQYEIFRRVWHDAGERQKASGLFLIGDPKQAVYSFRGADVFTYLAARDDASSDVHRLVVNWRSSPGLVAAVNALFSRPRRAFGLDAIEFNPIEGVPDRESRLSIPNRSVAGLRVLMADREAAAAAHVLEESVDKPFPLRFGRTTLMRAFARDVADLLDAGGEIGGRPIRPSDIAVLCRRKSELARARRALEEHGIPCVDRGDSDVFDSREAWELLSVLRALLRSSDPKLLRAALSTGAHGFDLRGIRALTDECEEITAFGERFAEYARIWSQSGFAPAFEAWRRGESVTERLLGFEDGDRRLTNWLHLSELLQRVENDRAVSRMGLVDWLQRAIAASDARGEVGSESSLLRLERDDQAVSLVTLHRSKGLEYPIVYLPSLWEEASMRGQSKESAADAAKSKPPILFHDETTGRRTLDLGGPDYADHHEASQREALSENFRLLYVGLTRAKEQCVVVWGAVGSAYAKTPLAWLLHARSWEAEGKERKDSATELRTWNDDDWIAAWKEIADTADEIEKGALTIETACFDVRDRWRAPKIESESLVFEAKERVFGRPFLTTSFSALVRNAHRASDNLLGPAVTGRDRDEEFSVEAPAEVEGKSDLTAAMDEFPRGAEAGTLLHDVLEQIDFSAYDESEVKTLAAQAARHAGFSTDHVDQIVHVVESVARTPLRPPPNRFCLADLPRGQQRPEIEFTLSAPGRSPTEHFSPTSLSRLLREADDGAPLRRYADRLSQMGWRTLNGYLRGFIDAVFFDGRQYFLIDYKSNHLGSRQVDYMPDRLIQPMIDHDYVLQYLIYAIALDRHLAKRLSGYDYDEHFGGVYYLFLRGLAESHEPGCGIFFDRPSRELIGGVSALLGDARGGGI